MFPKPSSENDGPPLPPLKLPTKMSQEPFPLKATTEENIFPRPRTPSETSVPPLPPKPATKVVYVPRTPPKNVLEANSVWNKIIASRKANKDNKVEDDGCSDDSKRGTSKRVCSKESSAPSLKKRQRFSSPEYNMEQLYWDGHSGAKAARLARQEEARKIFHARGLEEIDFAPESSDSDNEAALPTFAHKSVD